MYESLLITSEMDTVPYLHNKRYYKIRFLLWLLFDLYICILEFYLLLANVRIWKIDIYSL